MVLHGCAAQQITNVDFAESARPFCSLLSQSVKYKNFSISFSCIRTVEQIKYHEKLKSQKWRGSLVYNCFSRLKLASHHSPKLIIMMVNAGIRLLRKLVMVHLEMSGEL